jgi:small subunit ribosomal protein S16
MAVAIRLRRTGAKKRPFYRIVVADTAHRRSGQYVDSVGYYNPIVEPAQLEVDADRAIAWLDRGARPTETVRSLLARAGVLARWRGQQAGAAAEEATPPPATPRRRSAKQQDAGAEEATA